MPPGFLQLAGGTNRHTAAAMKSSQVIQAFKSCGTQNNIRKQAEPSSFPGSVASGNHQGVAQGRGVSGVAFGGSARSALAPAFVAMKAAALVKHTEDGSGDGDIPACYDERIEKYPWLLMLAVEAAVSLVGPIQANNCILE